MVNDWSVYRWEALRRYYVYFLQIWHCFRPQDKLTGKSERCTTKNWFPPRTQRASLSRKLGRQAVKRRQTYKRLFRCKQSRKHWQRQYEDQSEVVPGWFVLFNSGKNESTDRFELIFRPVSYKHCDKRQYGDRFYVKPVKVGRLCSLTDRLLAALWNSTHCKRCKVVKTPDCLCNHLLNCFVIREVAF